MNKNLLLVLAVVLFVGGGVVGYVLAPSAPVDGIFGATNASTTVISYSSSQNNQELWDILNNILIDLTAVRAPLGGLAVGSASVSWGTLVDNGAGGASSTVVNVPLGGTIGDYVFVQPATNVSSTVFFRGAITATGATNASATIYAVNNSTSSAAIGTVTTQVFVLPVSSFVVPSAIRVTTSTKF